MSSYLTGVKENPLDKLSPSTKYTTLSLSNNDVFNNYKFNPVLTVLFHYVIEINTNFNCLSQYYEIYKILN